MKDKSIINNNYIKPESVSNVGEADTKDVLGDSWRDVRKEPVPKDGKEYLLYTKTGIVSGWYCNDEDGTCFVCYDDEFIIDIESTEHGDYSEVIAWREIVKPAFA